MATPITQDRVRERIVRLCSAVNQTRQLRAAVLDLLHHAVDFDFYVFVLTDPRSCVGCDPLADVPMLDELPRLIRLKYATTVNRWTALDKPPVALLYEDTGGHRERSLIWREMLEPAGIIDVASSVFRDRFGCWGFLDLWRTAPSAPFTRADSDFLTTIAEPVVEALRRCQAATFCKRPGDNHRRAPLVLLLSSELTIRAQTRETHDYLRRLLPTPEERSPIPAAAYNVAAQLMAIEAGIDHHQPTASLHLDQGDWITVRAARMDANLDASGEIAVTIEDSASVDRLDIFGRAFGLSVREGELLTVLADGADTRQAGSLMHLSAHTIQDHLKSIFDKTGVRSRRELLARALG